MSGLMAIRASSEANSAEQKRVQERKRIALVVINQYLIENGYIEAAERLQHETSGVLDKFVAADNIDMALILSEYEAYYEMRFDKKPKLMRKLADGESNPAYGSTGHKKAQSAQSRKSSTDKASASSTKGNNGNSGSSSTSNNSSSGNNNNKDDANNNGDSNDLSFGIAGVSLNGDANGNNKSSRDEKAKFNEERQLRAPPQFGGDSELKALANTISREIFEDTTGVGFDDIIKLDEAKRLLAEAVMLPLRFPFIFTGILRPWRGILLHGPPGTGKTLLAKAVATECHTTFFNISASTLVSKWRGDSEKLVRVLFEVARYHSPSTIFLDEIDSIITSRNGEGGEHESSRRMKTELLIQMDGVASHKGGQKTSKAIDQVFIMAASNLPWDLDVAVLRRLEKRVLVGLPELEARELMFKLHLSSRCTKDMNFDELAQRTEGYSGADIELVCRESAMMSVRRLVQKVDALEPHSSTRGPAHAHIPAPPTKGATGTSRGQVGQAHASPNPAHSTADVEQLLKDDPVSMQDVLSALVTTKPSSDGKITKYVAWQEEFGSV